jgi:hypothetical protein
MMCLIHASYPFKQALGYLPCSSATLCSLPWQHSMCIGTNPYSTSVISPIFCGSFGCLSHFTRIIFFLPVLRRLNTIMKFDMKGKKINNAMAPNFFQALLETSEKLCYS